MQLHRPLSALTTGKTQNLLSSPPIYASLVNIVYACDATWCFPLGKGSRELSCHFPNPCSLQRAEQQDQEVKPGLTQPVFFPAGMSRTPWHTIQSLAKGWGCWSNHLLLLAFSAAGKSYRRGKNSQSSSLRLGKWITLCWFFQMCSPVQNKPKQLQKPCLADPTAAWPGHEQATVAAAGTGWMHKHTENTNMVHKDKTTTIKKKHTLLAVCNVHFHFSPHHIQSYPYHLLSHLWFTTSSYKLQAIPSQRSSSADFSLFSTTWWFEVKRTEVKITSRRYARVISSAGECQQQIRVQRRSSANRLESHCSRTLTHPAMQYLLFLEAKSKYQQPSSPAWSGNFYSKRGEKKKK